MTMPEDLEAQIKHIGIVSPLRELLESMARDITLLKSKVYCSAPPVTPKEAETKLFKSKKPEASTGG